MKTGIPGAYTPEIGEEVARLMSLDYTYQQIAAIEGMPSMSTIGAWALKYPDFSEKCARARLYQAHTIANKISVTADEVKDGKIASDAGRVAISAYQWLASKKNAKIYGDRQILAGDAENPITVLASRLDQAVLRHQEHKMIDVTPLPTDGSDLV